MTRNVGSIGKLGALFICAVIVAACSSGGDSPSGTSPSPGTASTTISGTAAGGAPLIGTITVKDSKGTEKFKTVDLAAAGAYSIDVTGLTPPFVLRADGTVGGTSVTYFSGTASVTTNGSVTVNITPFTGLIIGNVAGQIAANYYNNGNFSTLTTQTLNDEQVRLRDRLLPLLQAVGLSNTVDLLRASFNANGTGIDAALDAVRVTVDPATNTATIVNVINNQQIVDDLASKTDTSTLPATGTTPITVTEFQQIANSSIKTLENLFATSVPASNNAQLLALFDTQTFKLDGFNFDEFTSFLLTAQNIGVKFSVTLVSLTPPDAPTNAKIKLTVSPKNRIPQTTEWQLNKVTVNNVNTWRSVGNQWIAGADVQAAASNFQTVTSGLSFIGNDVPPGSTIDYAVVTGKGLDNKGGRDGTSQGLLLVNYRNGASMGVATPPYNGATEVLTPVRNQARFNVLPLTDTEILTIQDNEIYTVIFYDDNNTPNNFADDIPLNGSGYEITVPKRPYLSTELANVFPTFTSPTLDQLKAVALNGGPLTATWTLPAGQLNDVEFGRGTIPTGGGSITFDFVGIELETSALTTSFTVPPPGAGRTVNSVHLSLETQDSFGRVFQVFIAGSIP